MRRAKGPRCSFPACKHNAQKEPPRKKCGYHLRKDRQYQAWKRAERKENARLAALALAERDRWARAEVEGSTAFMRALTGVPYWL